MTSMSSGFTGDGCCNMGEAGDVQNGPDCVIIPGAVKVILDTFVLIFWAIWQVQSNKNTRNKIVLSFKASSIKQLGLRPLDAQVIRFHAKLTGNSRVAHMLIEPHLDWVHYNLYCSTFCQVLPVLMGNWQKWLSKWARW